jgi:hypothetical protein
MPVIQGADLTSVSTTREPLPEQEYLLDIFGSEMSEDGTKVIIKTRVIEPSEEAKKEFWDWCTVSGEWKEIGLQQVKRYLEAVFGKGSPEAEASPPDTDPLHGHQVRAYLTISAYKDSTGQEQRNNKAKRIRAA